MQPKRRWKRPSVNSSDSTDREAGPQPSEEELYSLALKTLTRRPYSLRELESKLLHFCNDSLQVDLVIERLKAAGYLDDRKYLETFIETGHRKAQGRYRITTELQAKGLSRPLVQEVLDETYPAGEEQDSLSRALEQKLRTHSGPMDAKNLAKIYNHLLRRGFSGDAIRQELEKRFKIEMDK
jgi:regulatory protein